MALFYYKAKNKNAVTVSGQLVADDQNDAIEKISQLGLLPVTVTMDISRWSKTRQRTRNVSGKTLYLFTRQLGSLIKSGISILRAMEFISAQQKNRLFQEVVESLRLSISQGRSLSESLAEYPKLFPGLYVSMIKAGEESGSLKDVLADLAGYQKSEQELLAKVRTAMAYPLMMLLFGAGTVFFILTYVLPQMTKLFDNLEQALPMPTLVVMQLSAWLTDGRVLFALIVVGIMAVAGMKAFFKSPSGQEALGRIILKVPGVGAFFLKVDLARFSRTLELLLKSGVPIVRALNLAIPVVGNAVVRQGLKRCHDELLTGRSFGVSLQACPQIPEVVGYLVAVGEESGSLTQTLQDIAENYEQDVQEHIKVAMTLLEPIMIVLVGGVVGFIIMAMLLPIFQMDILSR